MPSSDAPQENLYYDVEAQTPTLSTPRLVLRVAQDEDAYGLLAISRDRQVMRYYGMVPFASLDDARNEIAWMRGLPVGGEGMRWVITRLGSDDYLGDIGYHEYHSHHARAVLGYKLVRSAWRQGLMTEALIAVLCYGFEVMALNRAHALVDPRNLASQRLLAKQGFRCEGLLREYERDPDGLVDLEMWAVLRREWRPPDSDGL